MFIQNLNKDLNNLNMNKFKKENETNFLKEIKESFKSIRNEIQELDDTSLRNNETTGSIIKELLKFHS